MNKKLYWGLGVLFILIIGGFVFLLVQQKAELNEWEADAAKDKKKLAAAEKPPIVKNKPPPPEPGYEWVQHGDHYDKVKVAETHPIEHPVQARKTPTYTGPLTYHAELLKTNPVKALRLQAEERGHWSAKWIPPFPPDDLEAAKIARTKYLIIYYKTIGDLDNPECKKALRADSEQISRAMERTREIRSMGRTKEAREARGRRNDLSILSWPRFPEADIPQYPLYEKGWRTSSSNYYPMRIEDLKFPLQITDSK